MSASELEEALVRHRQKSAQASGGTSADSIYACIERMIRKRRLAGKVLDYGAGVGNLTQRLQQMACFEQISGADIMPRPELLHQDIDWFCLDLNAPIHVNAETFDLVVSSEVIEHLENPREMIRDLFRVLKPGGTLIVTTPNNETLRSLIALIVRGHFVAFSDSCYPAHITALLRKDLERILLEAGFSEMQFEYTDAGDIPGTRGVSWQKASFGLLKGLRFSDNVLVAALKPGKISMTQLPA